MGDDDAFGLLRPDLIACLRLPGFRGSPQLATRYADLLRSMALLDDSDPVGWIVDLTDNGGGSGQCRWSGTTTE